MAAWVLSTAQHSGLGIWHCCSCGVGHSCSSDLIPGPGNFHMLWLWPKIFLNVNRNNYKVVIHNTSNSIAVGVPSFRGPLRLSVVIFLHLPPSHVSSASATVCSVLQGHEFCGVAAFAQTLLLADHILLPVCLSRWSLPFGALDQLTLPSFELASQPVPFLAEAETEMLCPFCLLEPLCSHLSTGSPLLLSVNVFNI